MSENRYDVIYKGEVREGWDARTVKTNIARLFKADPSKIKRFFTGKPVTVKKNVDPETAGKFQNAFKKAGAVCYLVPCNELKQKTEPPSSRQGGFTPNIIRPVFSSSGSVSDRYGPIQCNILTAWENGVNINRIDTDEIHFKRLELISVFKHNNENIFLFFTKDSQRPYLVNAHKIRYSEFPGVKGETSLISVKNFVVFLLRKNPNIILDEATYEFLKNLNIFDIEKWLSEWVTSLAVEKEKTLSSFENKDASSSANENAASVLIKNKQAENHAPESGKEDNRPDASSQIDDVDIKNLLENKNDILQKTGKDALNRPSASSECPNCGFSEIMDADSCPKCGIVISKFLARQDERKHRPSGGQVSSDQTDAYKPIRSILFTIIFGMLCITTLTIGLVNYKHYKSELMSVQFKMIFSNEVSDEASAKAYLSQHPELFVSAMKYKLISGFSIICFLLTAAGFVLSLRVFLKYCRAPDRVGIRPFESDFSDENKQTTPIKLRILAFLFNRGLMACVFALFSAPYYFMEKTLVLEAGHEQGERIIGAAAIIVIIAVWYYFEAHAPSSGKGTFGHEAYATEVIDIETGQHPLKYKWIIRAIGVAASEATLHLINLPMLFQKSPISFADWASETRQYTATNQPKPFLKALIPFGVALLLTIAVSFFNMRILSSDKHAGAEKRNDVTLNIVKLVNQCEKHYYDQYGQFGDNPRDLARYCINYASRYGLPDRFDSLGAKNNIQALSIFMREEGYVVGMKNRYFTEESEEIDILEILHECQESHKEWRGEYASNVQDLKIACVLDSALGQAVQQLVENNVIRVSAGADEFRIGIQYAEGDYRVIDEDGDAVSCETWDSCFSQ